MAVSVLARAWEGWEQFAGAGKFVVLLVAVLLYLLIGEKKRGPQGRLVFYGAVMTAVCICPVTAMILMKYQTAFYDYQWIWSVVPMTALIAYGVTVFFTGYLRTGEGYRNVLYNVFLTALTAGAILLCGGVSGNAETSGASAFGTAGSDMAVSGAAGSDAGAQRAEAAEILSFVRSCLGTEEDICLCAPAEIVEYAGVQENPVKLLYGRNMWDAALNAYSYDVYPEEMRELYRFMEKVSGGEDILPEEGIANVQKAFEMGANCVLLPGQIAGWTPASTAETEVVEIGEYYLLIDRSMTGS